MPMYMFYAVMIIAILLCVAMAVSFIRALVNFHNNPNAPDREDMPRKKNRLQRYIEKKYPDVDFD